MDVLVALFAMVDRYTLASKLKILKLYPYIYLFFGSGYILRMVSYHFELTDATVYFIDLDNPNILWSVKQIRSCIYY